MSVSSALMRVLCTLVLHTTIPLIARAQETAEPVPVQAVVEVDVTEAGLTGRIDLKFRFDVEEAPGRPLSIVVYFLAETRELMRRDHAPPRPTIEWKAGDVVEYTLPATFPTEIDMRGAKAVDVYLGFRDPATKRTHPPSGRGFSWRDLLAVATFEPPTIKGAETEEEINEVLEGAGELARGGRKADAWSALETALRATGDDLIKYRFRKAMVALGRYPMRPLNEVEEATVDRRIADEKRRHLRLVAGRMFDRKRYHGALKILDDVGGALRENGEAAVIGAVDDASRNERDRQDAKNKLLEQISAEDAAVAAKELESLDRTDRLLEKARGHARKKRFPVARAHLRALRFAEKQALRDVAYRELAEVEDEMLAAIPADQLAEVEAAVGHPAWARTTSRASRHFIFIGPERLVSGIPDESMLSFDLAYVFLTDLFGRRPNPSGDRLTVYFKELWDFGGGVGGGVTIDIGRADPDDRKRRVDTGLMYHELTHCIDDTRPIHHGFREGLADFGATYAFEALNQKREAASGFRRHLASFKRDYLYRDLEYWRMPQYSPSAGFFLGFVERHAKRADGTHDWSAYRRFFRLYREAPVRDGREHAVVRGMAVVLVRAFGSKAFDDLVRFRFPLEQSDREAIEREWKAFLASDFGTFESDDAKSHPNSPLPRDRIFAELARESRRKRKEDEALRETARQDLGMVYEWRVIGPFREKGADPDACVFPPEEVIDLDAEYRSGSNVCRWQTPGPKVPVKIAPTGWVSFEYPYQDDTATYALTNVRVPKACDVRFHLRADDDVTLIVNRVLVGKYRDRGRNGSDWLDWRGPAAKAPDGIVFTARLEGGRNEVLVKVRNRGGAAGFVLAVTGMDNAPLEEWWADSGPPATREAAADAPAWKQIARHVFSDRSSAGKLDVKAGAFKVRGKRLHGTATNGGVGWRRFTVRPGFPKDSPSNLFWLRDRDVRKLNPDVRVTMRLAVDGKRAPKIAVTVMGDGSNDGLAGLTLIVHPSGDDKVAARFERYDRLVYQAAPQEFENADVLDLVLSIDRGRMSASLGPVVLFRDLPVRVIPDRRDVGVSLWKGDVQIVSMKVETRPSP